MDSSTDRWRRVKQLFAEAMALPPADRASFLERECQDATLRQEVESLVTSYQDAGEFLEQPLARIVSPLLKPGHRLGPYEVLGSIGAGGMGVVYRARDVRLDRIVALKVLPASAASDTDARRRFERESRAISSLNHPNICALYDVGSQDDVEYLVMEYLEGETLSARLERGPLPIEMVLRYGIEIADALERAHRQGIVHRDLKPSNVVVTESGAKLVDFGIAKLRGLQEERHGRMVGTVAYMSPEQVRGEEIDARSDLFSFGVLLYEMATGKRLFAGKHTDTVCDAILSGTPPPLKDLEGDLRERLGAILEKALESDRDRRYQHASEMRADLLRPRVGFARRWAVAAAVVLLVIAAVLTGRNYGGAVNAGTPLHSVAVLPFKPLVAGDNDENYIGAALADALITELGAVKTLGVHGVSGARQDDDPVATGRKVGADLVLGGATQRDGDRLRVSVHLVRVSDGMTVWSDRFDSRWTDVFDVQDAIAEQVARALAVTLTGEDKQRLQRRRTRDTDAYEAYLRGRYFWNTRSAGGFEKALKYFQEAIDRDPAYAPAYAGLADTYALLGSMPYAVMPPSEAGAKAKAAARRALEIDDTLSEAHVSLAFVTYSFDWDWESGGRGFRRAIELDPGYAPAHYWYSLYLGQLGRVREALAEAERARELDPLSPIGTYAVGLAHYYDRRFDEATQFALSGLEVAPSFAPSRRLLGSVYLAEGRHQEALEELRRLHESAADNSLHTAYLAHAYGRAGNRAKARELVAALIAESKTRFVPAAHIAIGYVGTGDVEDAFIWLNRAFDERSQALTFLKIDPLFDALKKDPRYPDLLRRVGFAR